jgi:hypothetical protein
MNSSTRGRLSTTVTWMPSAANIDAYSMPMMPPPTTTMVRGSRSSSRTWSDRISVLESALTPAGSAGLVPTAMSTWAARIVRRPSSDTTLSECGSTNEAVPRMSSTSLRHS